MTDPPKKPDKYQELFEPEGLNDLEKIIAELSQIDKPEASSKTKKFLRDELLTLLFGDRFTGWFLGLKRIFTILFVPLLYFQMLVWLAFVAYFMWQAAFHSDTFKLSDNVLIAMITSTTATVIGLFHYAAKWMFEVEHKQTDSPPADPPSQK